MSLFEISFVFGWLFGGGDVKKLDKVKQAALHFGLAFQIADDMGDVIQDCTNQRKINFAAVFGKEKALKMFHVEIDKFLEVLDLLSLKSNDFICLTTMLIQKAEQSFIDKF